MKKVKNHGFDRYRLAALGKNIAFRVEGKRAKSNIHALLHISGEKKKFSRYFPIIPISEA